MGGSTSAAPSMPRQLIVIDTEGHGGDAMMHTWRRVLADLA